MRLPAPTAIDLSAKTTPSSARLDSAARALEAQFAQVLMKSMRSASFGDSLFPAADTTYRDMYDQQMSRELTKGKGLGLVPMITRQLQRSSASDAQALPIAPLDSAPLPMRLPQPSTGLPLPLATPAPLSLTPSGGVSLQGLDPLPLPAAPPPLDDCDRDAPLDCSSPEAFVASVWPHAQRAADELGVSPKALVAQAALETGWGRRLVGSDKQVTSYNLFGIKAGGRWSGERVSAATHEFVGGVRRSERADFRAYPSAGDSFGDYARLLGNPRYADARAAGTDTRRFTAALQSAGYATDPAYAAKINAIIEGPTLNRAIAGLRGAGPERG